MWNTINYLLLESEDVSDAAIDGVSEAGLRLVANGDDGVEALVRRDVEEQLRHVARPKHLVHRREVGGALLRVEIRREYAPGHALPPQELACPTRPASSATPTAAPSSASASARRAAATQVSAAHNSSSA